MLLKKITQFNYVSLFFCPFPIYNKINFSALVFTKQKVIYLFKASKIQAINSCIIIVYLITYKIKTRLQSQVPLLF